MAVNVELVTHIAAGVRRDFETGLVSDDEIIEAAVAFHAVFSISRFIWPLEQAPPLIKAGKLRAVGRKYVPVPLFEDLSRFPNDFCNQTAPLLAQRLEVSGVLGENAAKIINGGCGEDKDALDKSSYFHNVHTFVDIGSTLLGSRTIVDITADQFEAEHLPAVYVGPLTDPWTANPRIEQHEW